jgi:phosphatidate cytidylyltransferase
VPLFVALASLYATGPAYLLFALFVVWGADVGAYFAGRRFGRVKLAPSISPGKTWEGVIGGLLTVAVVASVFAASLGLEPGLIVPFSMAAAALSVVGDLTVSMFKRTAGLKDSGKLFPGHGGILDRIDSVSAAAPLIAIGLTVAGVAA